MPIKTLVVTIVVLTFSFQLQAAETKENTSPPPEKRKTFENDSSRDFFQHLKQAHDLGNVFDDESLSGDFHNKFD